MGHGQAGEPMDRHTAEGKRMNIKANISLIKIVSDTLRDMLGEDFDTETFLDTLDGETDAMDLIGQLVQDREEAKAFEAASKALANEYTARAARLKDKQAAITAALGAVLDATGERKITHPLATVSRTKARAFLRITDEAAIPSQLTVTTTRPDAKAIKAQLDAGEHVPGAELAIGQPGLTVRIK